MAPTIANFMAFLMIQKTTRMTAPSDKKRGTFSMERTLAGFAGRRGHGGKHDGRRREAGHDCVGTHSR